MSRHHSPNEKTCLNCGNNFNGNFCPKCGQKAGVERLSVAGLISETIHSLTHYEKGFFHTIWHFLVKPGTASINFLKGKRKEYQRPVSYLLILTGTYILLHNFIIARFHYHYYLTRSTTALNFKEESNFSAYTFFPVYAYYSIGFCFYYLYNTGKK
ncbi:MAG: hypothetical protein JWO92_602 [Chitinophagaceae bacterium]|nr:hypothetical protein [Chitinophagaceae bacterium]